MAYEIRYSDFVNKGSIVIEDNTINQETTLKLPGRNTTAYGSSIAENFLHLLENFAAPNQPLNPVEGQLWYDNTPGVDQLKLYDGTTWVAAGGLKKANIAPAAANSVIGDLWVDTDNQQLYLFAGSGWVLVGPEFAEGLATGSRPGQVIAIDDATYDVVFVEVRGAPVAIVASEAFIPKSAIEGFENGLRPGINLSNANIAGDGVAQFNGISEKALNLFIPGVTEATSTTITAANVMRKDAANTTNFGINIKNNTGLAVGISNELKLYVDGFAGVLKHDISGSNLQIRMNDAGNEATVITVDSTRKVGVNNPSPQSAFDVNGDIRINPLTSDLQNQPGRLVVTSLVDSAGISGGSIVTSGGVGIAKNLNVGGITKIAGPLVVGKADLLNPDTLSVNPTPAAILPDLNNLRTIGQPDKVFSKMYATEFYGNFVGNVSGSVSGRAGQADKLSAPTVFRMTGQVTANNISFDGQQGTVTFNTTIDTGFIASQPSRDPVTNETVQSEGQDEFLINKSGSLFRVTRDNIFDKIKGLMPIGTILPYAGIIDESNEPPPGWYLCDGSLYLTDGPLSNLYDVIKRSYKSQSIIQAEFNNAGDPRDAADWFALPDLRGRIPLGMDSMGSKPAANRVTNPAADTLGDSSGNEKVSIEIENLPEHEHTLINNNGQGDQFYAISTNSSPVIDNKTEVVADLIGNATGSTYAGSGGVASNTNLGVELDIMNPFLTINYIIYAGDE
jgi:microcystin-dependent protein